VFIVIPEMSLNKRYTSFRIDTIRVAIDPRWPSLADFLTISDIMDTMEHQAETHTTLASWALAVERALQAEGADSEAIFAAAQIDRAPLQDPDARLPVAAMWRLWRAAVKATHNDAIGIKVAENLFPTHLNALMYAMQASATIEECIERLIRYAKVISTIGAIEVEYLRDQVCIRMTSSDEPDRPLQSVDALMSVVIKVIRDILPPHEHHRVLRVSLKRPEPEQKELFQNFFACDLEFAAKVNQIVLDAAVLEVDLPSANSELARVNDELLNEYLQRLQNETTSLKVRKVILQLLGSEELNQEFVAGQLHMSARNLHRKLAEEGHSFKELLDSTRQELALRYLKMANISIGELTYSLGFVDQSSFSRAFKRWTGTTPSKYRKTHMN
jgi:AraC-like DNA-binding protein